jgi:hypothetical protein
MKRSEFRFSFALALRRKVSPCTVDWLTTSTSLRPVERGVRCFSRRLIIAHSCSVRRAGAWRRHGVPKVDASTQLQHTQPSALSPQGVKMRRNLFIPLLVLLAIGVYLLVSHILNFTQIFFEHTGIAITQEEIGAAYLADGAGSRPQLIPKTIHHIFHNWHNVSMPKHWEETRQTCIDRNKDWEFIVSARLPSLL